jgi:hypothetical protein
VQEKNNKNENGRQKREPSPLRAKKLDQSHVEGLDLCRNEAPKVGAILWTMDRAMLCDFFALTVHEPNPLVSTE